MWQQLQCVFPVVVFALHLTRSLSLQMATLDDTCSATCTALGLEPLFGSPFAVGDPHLKNIQGEGFDVLRAGISTLLEFPQQQTRKHQENRLRIDASVEHPGNESACKGYFILRLWIKGSLLGDDIELSTASKDLLTSDSLNVKIGGTTMLNGSDISAFKTNGKYKMKFSDERDHMAKRHVHNRIKFASMRLQLNGGVGLEVAWFTGKKQPNRLDFKAHHLAKLGDDWGGILGADDHTWVSSYDPNCKKSKDFGRIAQLTMAGSPEPWSASASLD